MSEVSNRPSVPIDPTCLLHGKKWSEHEGGRCLYCCICFNSKLTPETCVTDSAGQKWDVCDTEECRTMAGIS